MISLDEQLKYLNIKNEDSIYIVIDGGSPSRSDDLNENSELTNGVFTFVSEGTINSNSGWVVTTKDPITVGSDAVTFSQFSNAHNEK